MKRLSLPKSHVLWMVCLILTSPLLGAPVREGQSDKAQWIHAIASLDFFLKESAEESGPSIPFSAVEIEQLWKKVKSGAYRSRNSSKSLHLFTQASEANKKALKASAEPREANYWKVKTREALKTLWDKAIEEEIPGLLTQAVAPLSIDPHLLHNRFLKKNIKRAMAPYHLSLHHPARATLDGLFLHKRATQDEESFSQAGFEIIAQGPRSYIVVAKHPLLPGFLVKAYFDSELRKKYHQESWQWLVKRCEGAKKIRTIIKKLRLKYFHVPRKWLYCFQEEPSPPEDEAHTRHLALLLVEDMNLVSEEENKAAWKGRISPKILDELFVIITRAKGSSYRPDNIAYTKNGDFAFIDTEYPTHGPDFKSIRRHLSSSMRHYWDSLIKQGGPR